MRCLNTGYLARFQSTHPARDATPIPDDVALPANISIHASREGCDLDEVAKSNGISDFNPRIPRGMRLRALEYERDGQEFQSTHPARDATGKALLQGQVG